MVTQIRRNDVILATSFEKKKNATHVLTVVFCTESERIAMDCAIIVTSFAQ